MRFGICGPTIRKYFLKRSHAQLFMVTMCSVSVLYTFGLLVVPYVVARITVTPSAHTEGKAPTSGRPPTTGRRPIFQNNEHILRTNNDTIYFDDTGISELSLGKHASNATNATKTKRLPQAIIIGVKKGGTRALLEYVRLHPDIKAPGPEPHFFDKYYKKGLAWYRNLMPDTEKGQLTIEKTPSYFVTKGIPQRVYAMSKTTKLIVVLRDPVVRAISDYAQLASRNPDVKPFQEMVFVNNETYAVDTSWTIVKIGLYAIHLTRWLEYFPLRQIHLVNGENLIQDPASELRDLQNFLGVKPYITEDNFTFNNTKGFPCYRRNTSKQSWHCLRDDKGREHPNVSSLVRDKLADFYRPFNHRLFAVTGKRFHWT